MDRVELADAVTDAIQDLAGSVDFHHATIECDELPTVSGDREQLRQLFFHLFDNSIKYRGEAPRIRVTCICEQGQIRINVDDNGIGVEKRHAERVFTIFKRLGFKDSVPGIGVGLAVCRRIVLRHGGSIWVEPQPTGVRICLTLREYRDRLPNTSVRS